MCGRPGGAPRPPAHTRSVPPHHSRPRRRFRLRHRARRSRAGHREQALDPADLRRRRAGVVAPRSVDGRRVPVRHPRRRRPRLCRHLHRRVRQEGLSPTAQRRRAQQPARLLRRGPARARLRRCHGSGAVGDAAIARLRVPLRGRRGRGDGSHSSLVGLRGGGAAFVLPHRLDSPTMRCSPRPHREPSPPAMVCAPKPSVCSPPTQPRRA